jgi:hypothetical protein
VYVRFRNYEGILINKYLRLIKNLPGTDRAKRYEGTKVIIKNLPGTDRTKRYEGTKVIIKNLPGTDRANSFKSDYEGPFPGASAQPPCMHGLLYH